MKLLPLEGINVLVLGGIGPVPFAAQHLRQHGATLTRVVRGEREYPLIAGAHQSLHAQQPAVRCDFTDPYQRQVLVELLRETDVVLEGFRPGTLERYDLGPEHCAEYNPAIVYGRMTGWGQHGPRAQRAGHDINYIGLAGALEPMPGADGVPVPPLNTLGDFGAGAMYLVSGVLSGLLHVEKTGMGCVIDAAITDGTANLTAMLHSMRQTGHWSQPRGENIFDGGAPFYAVYRTADDRFYAVGAIEPQFYAQLLEGLGLSHELSVEDQYRIESWEKVKQRFAEVFAAKSRDEWDGVFNDTDACATPVIAPSEVADEPHLRARETFELHEQMLQPASAPRITELKQP